MKKTLIIMALLGIIMFITNPSEEDFKTFYSTRIERIIESEQSKSNNLFSRLGAGFRNKINEISALNTIERKNYVIFSTYSVSIFGTKENYIGIFTKFIPITESIEQKIESTSEDIKGEIERLERELRGN